MADPVFAVDSLANYQHTEAIEDDLAEDLLYEEYEHTPERTAKVPDALNEPSVKKCFGVGLWWCDDC